MARRALPYCEQANHSEWDGDKAEIEPRAVSARIFGALEKLKAKPQANSKTEEQAYEIARRVVGRPDGLALGHADAQGQHHQDHDKRCAQYNCREAQRSRSVRGRQFRVRGILQIRHFARSTRQPWLSSPLCCGEFLDAAMQARP